MGLELDDVRNMMMVWWGRLKSSGMGVSKTSR